MKIGGFNLLKVLVICLVTLGILLGAQYVYIHFIYENPLVEKLNNINGVKNSTFVKEENKERIIIEMDNVDNLMETYKDISRVTEQLRQPPEIVLEDRPNAKLNKTWYEGQFAVYEGVKTGHFVVMRERLEEAANSQKLTMKVFIGDSQVYIQLTDADNYIYRVIDFTLGGEPVA